MLDEHGEIPTEPVREVLGRSLGLLLLEVDQDNGGGTTEGVSQDPGAEHPAWRRGRIYAPMMETEGTDSRLDKSTGHHVTQSTSCAGDDADFAVHTEGSKCTFGVSSVTCTLDVVAWVVV